MQAKLDCGDLMTRLLINLGFILIIKEHTQKLLNLARKLL